VAAGNRKVIDTLYVAYLTGGAMALALILASGRLRHLPVTEPLAGLLAGAALGPAALGWFVIPEAAHTSVLLEGSRLLLAVSLIGVALRFDLRSLAPAFRPVVVLVGIAMPVSAAVTGALAAALLGLPVALAALLGACLSPTDPVLASGVVTGTPAERVLPERTRQVLTEESGSNDGLALPLVLVALAAVLDLGLGGELRTSAYQVLVALAVAGPCGFALGKAVRTMEQRDAVERVPELLVTLFLALAVLGGTRLLRADAIVAVFVAGLGYNAAVGRRERSQQDALDEAFNRYLVVPGFLVLGAVLPFADWVELGWSTLPFAVGVLLLRRPPIVYLLRRLIGLGPLDAAFVGWFGPIGVSAVFYLVLARHEGVSDERLFAAGTLVIAASTVAHGISALPGRVLYRRISARHATPSGRLRARAASERTS
jgi:sodium/hydrogen antiporter